MNIVLIETSANQRYIFATNKLRENVGASELTYRVGTQFVLEAVAEETKNPIYEDDDLDGRKMRANLLNPSLNPPIENGNPVEVITATSGKALLLIKDKTFGEKIVRTVTARALREMPGLTVHGAISEGFNSLDEKDDKGEFKLHKAIGEVHRRLEEIRYQIPGNEQRFLRLPFVAPCATSGLPANAYYKNDPKPAPRSVVSIEKCGATNQGIARLEAVIRTIAKDVRLMNDVDQLEQRFKDLNWLAVIHADGNGLGEIFLKFNQHSKSKDGRDYIKKYRRFSLALDDCTINAAGNALEKLRQRFLAEEEREKLSSKNQQVQQNDKFIPVVPLVLGGDDLTILCDGQYALKFTQEFLKNFEEETAKDHFKEEGEERGIVPQIAFNAFGVYKLGICAGVAIVKPHFPFHQGYDLAESLLKSAKQAKEKIKRQHNEEDVSHPCSALDYHILYDSTASRLEEIRDRMKSVNKETWLYARPYVVSKFSNETLDSEISEPNWCKRRRWFELEDRVAAMMAKDEDNKRKLPNSQLHTLREALYLGKAETDARLNLIRHRYKEKDLEKGFDALLFNEDKDKPTLFFAEKDQGKEHATHFLDALDIVEFRKGEKEEDEELADKKPSA
jgi:hypothetical protein